jgi:hypothetical protein
MNPVDNQPYTDLAELECTRIVGPVSTDPRVGATVKALAQAKFDLINARHELDEVREALRATKADLNAVMRKVLTGSKEYFDPFEERR